MRVVIMSNQINSFHQFMHHQQLYIISQTLQNMGNNLKVPLPPLPSSSSQLIQYQNHFIKPLNALSELQHKQLIITLSQIKQHPSPFVLRFIDAHTVQSHSLCSVSMQLYAIIQRPKYTFKEYFQKITNNGQIVNSKILTNIVSGLVKALIHLEKNNHQPVYFTQSHIFIGQVQKGQITPKMLHPFFIDAPTEPTSILKTQVQHLGEIMSKYLNGSHPSDLQQTISQMIKGKISLEQLQRHFALKKNKIRLSRDLTNRIKQRPQRQSMTSNGSSLMIDAGEQSQYLSFRQFYQQQYSLTQIQKSLKGTQDPTTPSNDCTSRMTVYSFNVNQLQSDGECSHLFPKKFLKKKARKTQEGILGSAWSEGLRMSQDKYRIQPSSLELYSAKMVQSYIGNQ